MTRTLLGAALLVTLAAAAPAVAGRTALPGVTLFRRFVPRYSTDPSVLAQDRTRVAKGWADPENVRHASMAGVLATRRQASTLPFTLDRRGRPVNPVARTGRRGRGILGKWGPNFAGDAIVTRTNPRTGAVEMLAIQRKSGEWAIPGGFVDPGEQASEAIARELSEEVNVELDFASAPTVYRGYVKDPRNTDNAWIETTAKHIHLTPAQVARIKPKAGDDAQKWKWMPLDEGHLGAMYANHGDFVRLAKARVEDQLR